jgi:hypothetical protein
LQARPIPIKPVGVPEVVVVTWIAMRSPSATEIESVVSEQDTVNPLLLVAMHFKSVARLFFHIVKVKARLGVEVAVMVAASALKLQATGMGEALPLNPSAAGRVGSTPVMFSGWNQEAAAGIVTLLANTAPAPPAPVAPVEPVAPVVPVGPCEPVRPIPVGPVAPVLPVVPVTPCGPVTPVAPVGPVEPVAPFEPVAPVIPVAPVGPLAPVVPLGPVTPVAPVVPVGPDTPVGPVAP